MAAPITGQVSVTGTAQKLSATQVNCVAFLVKAPTTNAHAVFLGASAVTTSTGYPLYPGETFSYEHQTQVAANQYQLEPSDFYVVGTAGSDTVGWLASP